MAKCESQRVSLIAYKEALTPCSVKEQTYLNRLKLKQNYRDPQMFECSANTDLLYQGQDAGWGKSGTLKTRMGTYRLSLIHI